MVTGIEVSLEWWDDDVVILRVRASNGRFAGETELYAAHDAMPQLANALRGFPVNSSDIREYELGTFDPAYAKGGARLKLLCTDGVGHTAATIQLYSDEHRGSERGETASFGMTIEAWAVDAFVQQLQGMRLERGASARLAAV
jgi:hypothetical protein